jgi:hypothetical protein
MIATGGFYCGPELRESPINKRLMAIGRAIKMARGDWKQGDTPGVVVVFVVPGSLGDVNFTGQRITLFSRKKKLLQIEVAVPNELVTVGDVDSFVLDAVRQAIRTAAEHFERKKAGVFDVAEASVIVDAVSRSLSGYQR